MPLLTYCRLMSKSGSWRFRGRIAFVHPFSPVRGHRIPSPMRLSRSTQSGSLHFRSKSQPHLAIIFLARWKQLLVIGDIQQVEPG